MAAVNARSQRLDCDAAEGIRATPGHGAESDIRDDPTSRHIAGQGTPERAWQAWPGLRDLPSATACELAPPGCRVVVVAPHPDDEVLGCGGLVAQLARAGREILVVGVTDGEASHPRSTRFDPARLATMRRMERELGLQRLGLADAGTLLHLLHLPDGGIAASEAMLARALRDLLRPRDVVFATWRLDGHPDHEAVGRAAAVAARACGCRLHEMPVWMWHWAAPADRRVPWADLRRVETDDDARLRKERAVAAHASQLEPDDAAPAVLPHWALDRVLRPFECFFVDTVAGVDTRTGTGSVHAPMPVGRAP